MLGALVRYLGKCLSERSGFADYAPSRSTARLDSGQLSSPRLRMLRLSGLLISIGLGAAPYLASALHHVPAKLPTVVLRRRCSAAATGAGIRDCAGQAA